MKMLRRPNKSLRRFTGTTLALLLAAWLGIAQLAVAVHDAIHDFHVHVELCDLLSAHGNGPALTSASTAPANTPVNFHPGCSLSATLVTANPYPAFHSRAPPR
jgi:hypothetical protein